MGAESSHMVDDATPPETLQARTIEAVAEYIKSGAARRTVVMTGAGISTSAGIPDFRSPETGLYANLSRLNLPYPEAVFEIGFFRENPEPFYALAHELYPGAGRYQPTISHAFIRLLHEKDMLLLLFTQNIDCLERAAGVPDAKIVEAHGSFARQRCIDCKTEYPDALMREAIRSKSVPRCEVPQCNGLVKPDIVFFGEGLPERFFRMSHVPAQADLAIVMGTSLSVQPFASLPSDCRQATPRLLINQDRVGDMGTRADDVLQLGDCDDGVRRLADALGWRTELELLWRTMGPPGTEPWVEPRVPEDADEAVADEIDKLTKDIDESLQMSSAHHDRVRGELNASQPHAFGANGTEVDQVGLSDPSQRHILTVPDDTSGGNLDHVFPYRDKKPFL